MVVAETTPADGPDPADLKGFWSPGGQGVTYQVGVWHNGIVVLNAPVYFAVLMWRCSEGPDDVFMDLPAPVVLWL